MDTAYHEDLAGRLYGLLVGLEGRFRDYVYTGGAWPDNLLYSLLAGERAAAGAGNRALTVPGMHDRRVLARHLTHGRPAGHQPNPIAARDRSQERSTHPITRARRYYPVHGGMTAEE